MRPYTPSRISPPGIGHAPRRQPACFNGRALTGIGSLHVAPPSSERSTYVPSQPIVLNDHVQSPHSGDIGPRAQDGCSGFTPRLKVPQIVKLTSNVPSASSAMPQSQLPVSPVNGNTTCRPPQVAPPSVERTSTVCPLS